MELTIERYQQKKAFTLSRIYETGRRKHWSMDVLEPPIMGMTDSRTATLNPGRYKLYLKPDKEECDIIACFQRISRNARFGFVPVVENVDVNNASFKSPCRMFTTSMLMGNYSAPDSQMKASPEDFGHLMKLLVIAKQEKEIIFVNIK